MMIGKKLRRQMPSTGLAVTHSPFVDTELNMTCHSGYVNEVRQYRGGGSRVPLSYL